jgi:hypothetical protein
MFDLETRTTDPPLWVTATVAYSNAKPGFFLEVSIFDLDSGNLVRGSGSASSGLCDTYYADCSGEVTSPSGVGQFGFLIQGFKATMSLAIIAILYDSSGSLIYNSESDYEFVIRMSSAFVLRISIPTTVAVSVDGVQQHEGNVWLYLAPGPHEISVPDAVQLGNGTRMKFDGWSDGVNDPNRTIYLNQHTNLTATYSTQYLLAATSAQSVVSGSGWYNQGSNATFSVPSATTPMSGLVGLLGGKWKFEGWYENKEKLTSSTNGSMLMWEPHSVTAQWEPDYTIPVIALIVIALIIIVAFKRKNWSALQNEAKRSADSGFLPKNYTAFSIKRNGMGDVLH